VVLGVAAQVLLVIVTLQVVLQILEAAAAVLVMIMDQVDI
jgi:hypothetical protein